MNKNLVLTIAVGERYEQMKELTHPSIKKYAERIGADFLCIDKSNCSSPHWEKFQIYDLLNQYRRIIYLDTDILVREDCPSLFKIVPELQLGMFNEMPYTSQRNLSLIDSCKNYGIILKNWNGEYYNTGVIVLSRQHKYLFKKPEKEVFDFYEQGYFNAMLHKELEKSGNELTIFKLHYRFNRMTCMDQFTGEERYNSYIMHYAGYPSLDFVLNIMKKDIGVWSLNHYQYQRHILIDVQGGMGDQIDAEPSIRFMLEHIYPNEDVNILTHYPSLFKHLTKAKVFMHGEFKTKYDAPFYHTVSLPGPDVGIMWTVVSNLLCHTVDFCSMSLLRRTLPLKDKTINLEVNKKALQEVKKLVGEDLKNIVLIHAGRHWESKTFPIQWWQDVIDGLQREGKRVCLMGKDEKTRGALDLEVREGMIDTRNLLDIDMLIALISEAGILVTNDSAPVHIAGAFDNWVILIPTCKHPDHILPWRNGTIYYKTKALYKKLMLDKYRQAPTEIEESRGDKLVGDYFDYLPNVEDVVKETMSIEV